MAIVEMAIAMFNSASPLGARVGSIVVARRPLGYVGTTERQRYIWLQAEAPSEADLLALASPRFFDEQSQLLITNKFRWEWPIEELAKTAPGFDTLRALSPIEPYQPLLNLDSRTGRYSLKASPLAATPVRERGL